MKGRVVWEILARRDAKVVTTGEIAAVAKELDKDVKNSIRHLRRKLLVPLFKGYYYVRTPNEVLLNAPGPSALELFAMAAAAKGIGRWYFGLYTALRLNGLSHEHRNVEYVVGDSLYRINGVKIGSTRFVCLRWNSALVSFGLKRAGAYAFSDPEKTALDFAYWDHWRVLKKGKPRREWLVFSERLDGRRLHDYSRHYPEAVTTQVEAAL